MSFSSCAIDRLRSSVPGVKEDDKVYLVFMLKGRGGQLQCRIDGSEFSFAGKIFFPDRSWVDVEPGYAVVRITHEKEKYGFVTGVKFYPDNVDLEEIARIFSKPENEKFLDCYVYEVSYHGREFKCFEYTPPCVSHRSRRFNTSSYYVIDEMEDSEVYQGVNLAEILPHEDVSSYSFNKSNMTYIGTIRGCMFVVLKERLGLDPCTDVFTIYGYKDKYKWENVRRFCPTGTYTDISDTKIGEVEVMPEGIRNIIYDALDDGIIEVKYYCDIEAIKVEADPCKVYKLLFYSTEEISTIRDFLVKTNEDFLAKVGLYKLRYGM